MKEKSNTLLKLTSRLTSISTVLEEFESSFKDSLSAQLHDVHHLQESILKTKQVFTFYFLLQISHFIQDVYLLTLYHKHEFTAYGDDDLVYKASIS